MEHINVYANAKINLALDVLGKRPDGYHEISSIMQSVNLKDYLFIKKISVPKIKIVSNIKWLPVDEKNLVYMACRALFDIYNPDKGVYIELTKRIPISAGLGGGSADCAATLYGIKKLFSLPISDSRLLEIGKKLGADVPFCMKRGTMLAKGIGEELTRLPDHPFTYIVLIKPNINISTAKVFKEFDNKKIEIRPNIGEIANHIKNDNIDGICSNLCNVLETVTIEQYPIIDLIKSKMLENGATGALMSGSGPTVFGYFRDKKTALSAMWTIKRELKIKEAYLTSTYNCRRNLK